MDTLAVVMKSPPEQAVSPLYEHSCRAHAVVTMGHEKRPSAIPNEPSMSDLSSSRSTLAHQVGYAFWDRSTRKIIEFDYGFARVVPWLPAMLTCRFGEGNSLSDDARLQPRDTHNILFYQRLVRSSKRSRHRC